VGAEHAAAVRVRVRVVADTAAVLERVRVRVAVGRAGGRAAEAVNQGAVRIVGVRVRYGSGRVG